VPPVLGTIALFVRLAGARNEPEALSVFGPRRLGLKVSGSALILARLTRPPQITSRNCMRSLPISELSWTCARESSSFDQRVIKCQRRPSVEHRGISFSVVEMSFPRGWKWTVGKGKTVTVGVCATRLDAIRQAQTFIDAVIDWAA
jgi:hypothetical protein